jgi:hypothetical protein
VIGNNEEVTISTPTAGTYYIMLNAYQAFSGISLVATHVPIAEPIVELINGVPEVGLSGATNEELFFKIVVPAGLDYLDFEMSGGTGDADMYIRKGSKPTMSNWDYRPYLIGNNESTHIDDPAAATWYVMLKAYQAFSGVSLVATYGTDFVWNDFTADPNCVALWQFEEPNLAKDSIGTNILTNHGVDANTVDFQEGAAGANFNGKDLDYFKITDVNLAANFPLKSTGNKRDISVSFWFRPETLPGLAFLWAKYDDANSKISFAVNISNDNGIRRFAIRKGASNGAGYEQGTLYSLELVLGRWYHVAATYDDTTRAYRLRVYDPVADAVHEATGIFTKYITLTDAPVMLGNRSELDWPATGVMDECVVFNDVLTAAEIDKIRQGIYGKP